MKEGADAALRGRPGLALCCQELPRFPTHHFASPEPEQAALKNEKGFIARPPGGALPILLISVPESVQGALIDFSH